MRREKRRRGIHSSYLAAMKQHASVNRLARSRCARDAQVGCRAKAVVRLGSVQFQLAPLAQSACGSKVGSIYGRSSTASPALDPPVQDNWRAGPGAVAIPPKADKLRKRRAFVNSEVRKAGTPATRAKVLLAAIQCLVRYENGEKTRCL
jgi:hypothetical protein